MDAGPQGASLSRFLNSGGHREAMGHVFRLPWGWLYRPLTCAIYRAHAPAVPVLKFLMLFEQEAPHFHFALAPANSVAGPGLMAKC